jgi:hypothetical protein
VIVTQKTLGLYKEPSPTVEITLRDLQVKDRILVAGKWRKVYYISRLSALTFYKVHGYEQMSGRHGDKITIARRK